MEAERFDAWIEAIDPARMLVCIDARLGPALRGRVTREDIWQETLLEAWRSRASFRGDSVRRFRAWVLGIVDNRIRDVAEALRAIKRGGGRVSLLSERTAETRAAALALPVASTTPSRLMALDEEASRYQAAFQSVEPVSREIVRARLFDGLTLEAIADRTGLTVPTVKYRLRKGALAYERALRDRVPE